MQSKQSGLSLMGLIAGLVVLALLAVLGMKILPSFLEYRSAKTAIEGIAAKGVQPVNDIRRAFDARAQIDDVNAIKSSDLEITKDGNGIVISFSYRKEVPLWSNVGLYIDYAARAGAQ